MNASRLADVAAVWRRWLILIALLLGLLPATAALP